MKDAQVEQIRSNYHQVLERIASAARHSGRQAEAIRLVVVTKAHPISVIRSAIEAGARDFGENYLQEAQEKIEALSGETDLTWHMIGHIQSRKAPLVGEYFDWVHSIDRLKIARTLSQALSDSQRRLPVLLECNTSGEESKYGFAAWKDSQWDQLELQVEMIMALPGLQLSGLMTMAPYFEDPELARPYFRRLRSLRDHLARRFTQLSWSHLSMGMSSDFEVAIEEGATIVRVGTAIVGARPD